MSRQSISRHIENFGQSFKPDQWRLQPDPAEGAKEPRLSSERQESKQRANLFTRARDYTVGKAFKTFSGLL